MRKLQRAAVVAAISSSLGLIGAGTAVADGWGHHHGHHGHHHGHIHQDVNCKTHSTAVSILNISIANGLLLNGLIGNEGGVGNTSQGNIAVTCAASVGD
ncbi:hypothetical protein [Streptomyces sp. KR80]|uniref:hypothetical protein n=1 Tax=Streptomyces sp. KR80 TaxID=3457426 RepID=UPI003FD49B16